MPRQYGKHLDSIRDDHVERYEFAADDVYGDVLDAACGCGYGSFILATESKKCNRVHSIDISQEAINYANKHWSHERIKFHQGDLNKIDVLGSFDWLVCFETIEHLEDPRTFLKLAAKYCKNIICSVPNENIIKKTPNRYKYHYRHYTKPEIFELLEECGFAVIEYGFQKNHEANGLTDKEGRTIFVVGESYEYSVLNKTK